MSAKRRPEPRQCFKCARTFRPVLNSGDTRLCRACQFKGSRDVDLATYEEAFQKGVMRGRSEAHTVLPIMDLIQLCHPDRHPLERRKLANEVTAQLNGLIG